MEEGKSFPSQVPKSLAGPKDASRGKGGTVSLAWHLMYWPAQGMPAVEEEEQLPDLASHLSKRRLRFPSLNLQVLAGTGKLAMEKEHLSWVWEVHLLKIRHRFHGLVPRVWPELAKPAVEEGA